MYDVLLSMMFALNWLALIGLADNNVILCRFGVVLMQPDLGHSGGFAGGGGATSVIKEKCCTALERSVRY